MPSRGSRRTQASAAQNRIIWAGLGFAVMAQYSFLSPMYYTAQVCAICAIVCAAVVIFWKIIEFLRGS